MSYDAIVKFKHYILFYNYNKNLIFTYKPMLVSDLVELRNIYRGKEIRIIGR